MSVWTRRSILGAPAKMPKLFRSELEWNSEFSHFSKKIVQKFSSENLFWEYQFLYETVPS